jgi:predicted metal-binding membrane protein
MSFSVEGQAMAEAAASAPGTRTLTALPGRELIVPWIAVGALATAAWAVTVALARTMGNGPGTMGLALLPFLGLWVVMMAAMMLPSAAPVAVLWARLISGASAGLVRAVRMSAFLTGYLLAWAACGMVAYATLAGTGRLVVAYPGAARWLGLLIFASAGVYQLTPLKDFCLRGCRTPIGALIYYSGFRGRGRDVRVGLHHGVTCAGCCWALMIVLIAVGVMNIVVMVALAAVVFVEKLWRHGKLFGQVTGVALVATGIVACWHPELLPGLHASGMPAM